MTAQSPWITVDGNEAVARVAYKLSELIAIYPITPSSSMGELADQWMSDAQPNLWNTVPTVAEMQSEGGAAVRSSGRSRLARSQPASPRARGCCS